MLVTVERRNGVGTDRWVVYIMHNSSMIGRTSGLISTTNGVLIKRLRSSLHHPLLKGLGVSIYANLRLALRVIQAYHFYAGVHIGLVGVFIYQLHNILIGLLILLLMDWSLQGLIGCATHFFLRWRGTTKAWRVMPFCHLFAIRKTWFFLQSLQVIIITHWWLCWL